MSTVAFDPALAPLVTIPNVELVAVGDWSASTGPVTFTADDLAAAVAAVADSSVHAPRLRIGHSDPNGTMADSSGGFADQPAFGRFANLRLADNGTKIVADMVGVPGWLADILPVAYPSRSVEAYFDVTTAAGRKHGMVITSVALLGVTMPAVETLEDLRLAYGAEAPDGVQVLVGKRVTAQRGGDMPKRVAASVTYTDVRESFYEDFATEESGRYWWWLCDFVMSPPVAIADDDDGDLWAIPYTISGDTVTWGDPVEVRIQYVDAATGKVAASHQPDSAARAFASSAESRPKDRVRAAKPKPGGEMSAVSTALLERLGLPADATEEQAIAKIGELYAEAPEGDPAPVPPVPPAPPVPDPVPEREPELVSAALVVPVDRARLASLEADAAAGRAARDQQIAAEADSLVDAAKRDGRIAPASASAWRQALIKDGKLVPTEAAALASLSKGRIPVDERGIAPDESENHGLEAQFASVMASFNTNQKGR